MIRYRGLGQVALNVTDLERSSRFYETVVDLRSEGIGATGERFLRAEGGQQLILFPGQQPGLKWLGWEMEDASQLEILRSALDQSGIPWRKVSANAIEMVECNTGATLHYSVGDRQLSDPAHPVKTIGHVVLQTPRYREAVQFFRRAINFRASDEIEDRITFLRCFPNPLHHSIGIASGRHNRLHHVCFMVPQLHDLDAALDLFKRSGIPIMSRRGRHPPSGSSFLYFLDPDGLTLEYSHGMERLAEPSARSPRMLPPTPESTDFDAAPRDTRIFAIGSIESAH